MFEEIKDNAHVQEELRELRRHVSELEEHNAKLELVEKALRLSERYFRSLIEHSMDLITIMDSEGRVTYENPSITDILGYGEEELLGKSALGFVHPDDLERTMDAIGRSVADPEAVVPLRYRFRHKDGSWRVLDSRGKVIHDESGMQGIIVNSRDITESEVMEEELRRYRERLEELVAERTRELEQANELLHREIEHRSRVEAELREREERYRLLAENVADVIWTCDLDFNWTYVSPSVELTSGYSVEEAMSMMMKDMVTTSSLQRILGMIHEAREAFRAGALDLDKAWRLELEQYRKDGSTMWVGLSVRVLKDAGGMPVGLLGVSRVITERKKAEEELQRRERYFRSLIGNTYDVITVMKLDGTMEFVSPSVKAVFGYEPEELVGRNALDYVHPDDLPEVVGTIAEGADKPGHVVMLEYRTRHKDGSWRLCEAMGKNLLHDSAVHGAVVHSRDITRSKTMEQALRESEEKFRLLSDQSMIAILIIQDDRVKYANQAASDIFEYGIEEAWDWGLKEIANRIHPEDLPFVIEQMQRKQTGEEDYVVNYNFRVLTKTGRVKWVEIYAKTVPFEGRPADMVTMVDISDRVRMEEELKLSEERFRSLIENSLDVIMVVDEQGAITYVSPGVERVLGYTPEEVMGGVGLSFIHPDEIGLVTGVLEFLLANPDEPLSAELHARHKDGSWRDVEATVSNFLDHPSVRGIIVNYRDITERKAARQKLERINHLFLSLGTDLFENMEKIVEACHDVLGGQLAAYCRLEKGKLTVLSTAPGEEAFFVADDPKEFVGHRIVSLGMSDPMIVEDLDGSLYLDTDPIGEQYGSRSFIGYPVCQKTHVMGCLCLYGAEPRNFSHDEVELIGMLARTLAVEEERFSHEQSLKDFVDVASHELRHPITLMKGYAITLGKYGDRLDDDVRQEYLGVINQGVDRLDMLIKELLDVSRIERGRFAMYRKTQDLVPLLERAVKEMEDKGCLQKLILSVPDGLSPRMVDGEKLVRILVILLDNAVAHFPAGFVIMMTAEEKDGEAVISVIDSGVGIPEKDRELIFERFYQVEDALHHTTRGMGLGLYIAREIVEAHGGRIWHEPGEDGGSIFRFTIP